MSDMPLEDAVQHIAGAMFAARDEADTLREEILRLRAFIIAAFEAVRDGDNSRCYLLLHDAAMAFPSVPQLRACPTPLPPVRETP